MSERLAIDCHELWDKVAGQPDGRRAVQRWLRLNGIEPGDVPLDSEMVIEPSAFGMVIRYTPYQRNAEGRIFVDPDLGDRPSTKDSTALLRAAPLAEWLSAPDGER